MNMKKNCTIGCPDCEEIRNTTKNEHRAHNHCKNEACNKDTNESKDVYRCAICGTEHDSIAERIKCEMKCLNARTKLEEQKKQEALKHEKAARIAELNSAYKYYIALRKKFIHDYGYYQESAYLDKNSWF